MSQRTLVLGGGGVAGIAWMTGLLLGLEEGGVALRDAERMIGTSAGATVAAQIRGRLDLPALFARQVEPALQVREISPAPHLLELLGKALPVLLALGDRIERTRRIGSLARDCTTVDEATRRAVIAARLPEHGWPMRPLTVVAVDTASGNLVLLDSTSGVSLVDAVAASCAVPGLWPPVTLLGRRCVDGGMRSADNADLAAGPGRVLIVSPLSGSGSMFSAGGLDDEVEGLRASGTEVQIVAPDQLSLDAIGRNPLTPETRTPTAHAGRAQGRRVAEAIGSFWSGTGA